VDVPLISAATPLDPDEAADLIPAHLATVAQLNEWESTNILLAEAWAFDRRHTDVTTEDFVKALHRRMFDQTWRWAGRYRTTEKNLGSPPHLVPTEVREACANAAYWRTNRVFTPTELAVRFHHRIVAVHPFPNGNGRHARLLADVTLFSMDEDRLTWGRTNLQEPGSARSEYIGALRAADSGDFKRLLRLSRS
jgi:Fic-DOC domain mobile mystery protein B